MKRLAIVALLTTTACASQSAALRASDSPYNGPGAGAYYEIVSDNHIIGDVKVWSPGAKDINGHAVIELGLRVRNNVDTPITLDPSGCGIEVSIKKETIVVDDETSVSSTDIPPGQMARITLTYTLPEALDMDDISAIDFYWRLIHNDNAFTRSTTFQHVERADGGAYYSPFWGYGAWGPWGMPYYWGGGVYYRPVPAGPPPTRALPPRR